MRHKRAIDAVDETVPDGGRVAKKILQHVAKRRRRLKEQVPIRDVDSQIASECPRVHRLLIQINGDLFVYVDRVELVTRKALRRAFQIDRVGMCSRCSEQRCDDDGCFQLHSYLVALRQPCRGFGPHGRTDPPAPLEDGSDGRGKSSSKRRAWMIVSRDTSGASYRPLPNLLRHLSHAVFAPLALSHVETAEADAGLADAADGQPMSWSPPVGKTHGRPPD